MVINLINSLKSCLYFALKFQILSFKYEKSQFIKTLHGAGEGGESTQKKFHTGTLYPEVQPLTLLYSILTENVPLLGRASPYRTLQGVQYPPHHAGTAIICICRGKGKRKFNGGVSLRRQLTFGNVTLTVSLQNDVWGTNAEIPCRWHVTNRIRFVILIGWSKFPTRNE